MTTSKSKHALEATLIPTSQINEGIRRYVNVAEAAERLQVSEATIRRVARRLGVRRIAGRVVAGGILIEAYPVPLVIVYSA